MDEELTAIQEILDKRIKTSHKGENGKLLIIGGSYDYVGAPALCGLAALRCGIDLVTIATLKKVGFAINTISPDLIVKKFKKYDSDAISNITQIADSFDVVLIGNGLGKDNVDFAKEIIESINKKYPEKKLVIDADGIHAMKTAKLKNTKNIILTPHKKEFEYLTGLNQKDKNKINVDVASFVKDFDGIIVIKGNYDLIAQKEKLKENTTGNSGMTVGGTGDVLAGIISALFCFCDDGFSCACVGTYICGKAGDMAFLESSYGMIASDLIENIPSCLFCRKTTNDIDKRFYV